MHDAPRDWCRCGDLSDKGKAHNEYGCLSYTRVSWTTTAGDPPPWIDFDWEGQRVRYRRV